MNSRWGLVFAVSLVSVLIATPTTHAAKPSDGLAIGMAFLTNLAIHESAHYIVADQAGADGNKLQFFSGEGGSFFLGLSTVTAIDNRSKLSYNLAGEVATSYTFEWALQQYREDPTLYNKALIFFSGTDFLWYSLYSFYLSAERNPMFDPIGIAEDTGLDKDVIFGIALTQFSLNVLRVATGEDRIVPYFTLDPHQAGFGLRFQF